MVEIAAILAIGFIIGQVLGYIKDKRHEMRNM
ncbi:hypothetical protein LCGC14_1156950 [marine sediment metagenome]|uniref:Uncharacterized protein n=1 Tax=marine sediment metagenome TaxID=412755 RepID=A0A0F9LYR8_9ZZZZ